ncbi:hypothetical protein PR048_030193 [Dryococelus australis]|uniref:Uncharacterized protein n=1 Tax=Dryococelus australis TaxID=614101 RepID=A0ABQ9G896_9NEOP|nr:hypothetical protein PR048_030193 [Dryococelus australis]
MGKSAPILKLLKNFPSDLQNRLHRLQYLKLKEVIDFLGDLGKVIALKVCERKIIYAACIFRIPDVLQDTWSKAVEEDLEVEHLNVLLLSRVAYKVSLSQKNFEILNRSQKPGATMREFVLGIMRLVDILGTPCEEASLTDMIMHKLAP